MGDWVVTGENWVVLGDPDNIETCEPGGLEIRAVLRVGETSKRGLAGESLSGENVADGGGSGESGKARVEGATGVEDVDTARETGLGGVDGGSGGASG